MLFGRSLPRVAVTAPVSSRLLGSSSHILDCTQREVEEIGSALDFGADRFTAFEAFLEARTDIEIKNCLGNRFQDNGEVVWEAASGGQCSGSNGWASYLNKRAHFSRSS